MAGMPGRSGGPRANSGGARPGAGRKPKPIAKAPETLAADPEAPDMLRWLQEVALGRIEANATQVRAAVAAVQYTHTKRHDGGKKDEQAERAERAGSGKFAAAPPPLKLVGGAR
jgi:phage terminase small subunit